MIRWVAVIFIMLAIFYPLIPWLDKLRVGHLPGDVRFKLRGVILCLPFGSTVLWAAIAFAVAEVLGRTCMFC